MPETIAIIMIIFLAAFLQGMTGFGFALIALPLLGFFLDIKVIVPLVVLLGTMVSAYLSIRLRKAVNLKRTYALMLATLPGVPLGAFALKHVPQQGLALGIGILMVLFTTYLLLCKPSPLKLGLPVTALVGFSSGALGSSIGAGGPPAIIYASLQPWDKAQSKATLSFYFTFVGGLTVVSHTLSGIITKETLSLYAAGLPALALGIWLGTGVYKRLSDHGYRKLAFILVFLLGCMMIYRNV